MGVHYRTWFEWLGEDGVDVAGKKPLATFLTQLNRTPLVRRGEDAGVYVLDPLMLPILREKIAYLQAQLSGTDGPPLHDDAARRELRAAVDRAERSLREGVELLAENRPAMIGGDDEADPRLAVLAWIDQVPSLVENAPSLAGEAAQ
jgi:hypothetical protein